MTSSPGSQAALQVAPARPDVQVITVRGQLDRAGATRLLRVIEGRLQLVRTGQVPTRHLIVDLGEVDRIDPAAATILTHAHHAALSRAPEF